MACVGASAATRDLSARGHAVTGLDASPTLVQAAAGARPRRPLRRGPSGGAAFDDGAFDLVVAYNVLMDVDDMPQAVAEAAVSSSQVDIWGG